MEGNNRIVGAIATLDAWEMNSSYVSAHMQKSTNLFKWTSPLWFSQVCTKTMWLELSLVSLRSLGALSKKCLTDEGWDPICHMRQIEDRNHPTR